MKSKKCKDKYRVVLNEYKEYQIQKFDRSWVNYLKPSSAFIEIIKALSAVNGGLEALKNCGEKVS